MKNIYLIGEHLSHSYSPEIHSYLYNYNYSLKELNKDELDSFFKKREFDGLNVTIPYKNEVIKYLDKISPEAEKIGAVNTVLNENGVLTGYNTDYFGFMEMVKKSGADVKNKSAVVVGGGGASKAVCAVLYDMGAKEVKVLAHKDNTPEKINEYTDCDVLVNASPVGMYPNNGISPVDLEQFKNCTSVLDLIYNPAETKLLQSAERLGKKHINGLYMLVAQAKKAAEIFTGEKIDNSLVGIICRKIEMKTKNIVLIGMPGCGKTTVGKLLSQKLSRDFHDSDSEIERKYMHPAEFITTKGEKEFRAAEHEILGELGRKSGCVIATGGGVVTRNENYDVLRQNSTVIFLKRDISLLATENRPLSKDAQAVENLYKTRLPLYKGFCHAEVDADITPELTCKKIIDILEGMQI